MNKCFLLLISLAVPAYLSADSVRISLEVERELLEDMLKGSRVTRAEEVTARCSSCGGELNTDDDEKVAENRKCKTCGSCCCAKCSTCPKCCC